MKQLGLLGKKLGMLQLFMDAAVVPVTVIQAGPCTVIQRKTKADDGYEAIQLAFGTKKPRQVTKSLRGHVKKAGDIAVPKVLKEFRIAADQPFKAGDVLDLSLFSAGDLVSISGVSKGKGFAGTVKRHHFGRGDMSHGSKSHRIPGSIGAGTDPGRVFKGTRMAGRLGGEKVTLRQVKVVRVDEGRHLLFVKGAVPGPTHGLVTIEKALKA